MARVGGVTTGLVALSLVSNPVGWAIIAGAGAVAVGAWVYENWETVTDVAGKAWDGTKEVASDVWEGTKAVGGSIKDGAADLWNGVFG